MGNIMKHLMSTGVFIVLVTGNYLLYLENKVYPWLLVLSVICFTCFYVAENKIWEKIHNTVNEEK